MNIIRTIYYFSLLLSAVSATQSELIKAARCTDVACITELVNNRFEEFRNDLLKALTEASMNGCTDVMKFLLEHKLRPDVNAVSNHLIKGATPLIVAARAGHINAVITLAETGANVNAMDNKGWTPLVHASIYSHLAIVKYLLENGATVDNKDKKGKNALEWAKNAQKVSASSAKLKARADDASKIVNLLAERMNANRRKALNDDLMSVMVEVTSIRCTAAEEDRWVAMIRQILDWGADPNVMNNKGLTPLIMAKAKGLQNVAKLLTDSGADMDAVNEDGWTPLMWALRLENHDIIKILVRAGVKLTEEQARTINVYENEAMLVEGELVGHYKDAINRMVMCTVEYRRR